MRENFCNFRSAWRVFCLLLSACLHSTSSLQAQIVTDTIMVVTVPATASFQQYKIGGIWGDSAAAGPAIDCGIKLEEATSMIIEATGAIVAHGTIAQMDADGYIVSGYTVGGITDSVYTVRQRVPEIEVATELPVEPGYFGQLVGLFVDQSNKPIGSAFIVGSRKSLETPAGAAHLLFAINDDGFADNTGSFQVITSVILPHPNLNPINPDKKPEAHMIFSLADTSHGLIHLTSVIHNNGNKDAFNVVVQFWVEDLDVGSTEMVQIGNDQIISSIGKGDVDSTKVIWHPAPISHHYKLFVHVDPQNWIDEFWEDDNVATFTFEGITAGKLRVQAQYDGNASEDIVGTFLTGIQPSVYVTGMDVYNTFNLISDRPYAISKVKFDLHEIGKTITDTNPSDGWQATFNMAELKGGFNTLVVTPYDLSGRSIESQVLQLEAVPFVGWLLKHFPYAKATFHVDGYYTIDWHPSFNLVKDTVDTRVEILGNAKYLIDLDLKFIIKIGLDRKVEVIESRGTIRGTLFGSHENEPFEAVIRINDDLSFSGLNAYWDPSARSIPLVRGSTSLPIGWLTLKLTAGADFLYDLYFRIHIDGDGNFVDDPKSEVTPSIGLRGLFVLEIDFLWGVASAGAELNPTLAVTCHLYYTTAEGTKGSELQGTFFISYKAWAKLFWGLLSLPLAEGQKGPWTLFGSSSQLMKMADLPDIHGLFPQPHIASGTDSTAMVIWVHNVGTEQEVNPEIFHAIWNGVNWSDPKSITNNEKYETNPRLAFAQNGDAMAIWTQNKLPKEASPDLTEVLSQQEIYYSYWNCIDSQWSVPQPITNDYLADGMATLSMSPEGKGFALWTRSLDDNLSATNWEIYYAIWDGTQWSAPQALTNNNSADCSVEIAHSSDGKAIATWLHDGDGDFNTENDTEVFYSFWNGNEWNTPAQLTFDNNGERDPSVAFAPNGDALVVWSSSELQPDSRIHEKIYCTTWKRSTSEWQPQETVVQSLQFLLRPTISITLKDSNPIAMVMFRGYDGYDGDIFASMKNLSIDGSKWTTPTQITADTLTDWMAASAIDSRNNALFVSVKTDLVGATPQAKLGNIKDGLSFVAKGIKADLSLSDQLNFAALPIAPDLKIEGNDMQFDVHLHEGTAYANAGDTVMITAKVYNVGGFLADSVKIRFFDGHPDSGGVLIDGDKIIERILADSSQSVQVEWIATPGIHKIHAALDPENKVAEVKEQNNMAFQSIHIVPDLIVSRIRFSNFNPAENDTVAITGIIGNLSGATTSTIIIRFFRNNPDSGGIQLGADQTIPSLAVGREDSVSVDYVVHSGIDTIYVVLYHPSGPEKDESNNQRLAILTVLPDLSINSDLITFTEDDSGLYFLKAEVYNMGGVEAFNVPVLFFEGNPLWGGRCIDSTSIDTVSAFSSQVAQVSWPPHYGSNLIFVQINSDRTIAERWFINNKGSREFIISAKADLVVDSSDIYFSIPSANLGDRVEITILIHNIAVAFANGVVVECLDGRSIFAGNRIGQRTIVSVPPGQTDTLRFVWNTTHAALGVHEVVVYIDPENSVYELNEGNNSASRKIPIVDGVRIADFTSEVRENNVLLRWRVSAGERPTGFVIERSSDKLNFQYVGFVDATMPQEELRAYWFEDKRLSVGVFYYRLKITSSGGLVNYSQPIQVQILPPTDFSLRQNYPNPFNTLTNIEFQLPQMSNVTIKVFNLLGQQVKTLLNEEKIPGYYKLIWNARNDAGLAMASGIYLLRMEADGFVQTRKLLLVK